MEFDIKFLVALEYWCTCPPKVIFDSQQLKHWVIIIKQIKMLKGPSIESFISYTSVTTALVI